jgi:hypothetical protein
LIECKDELAKSEQSVINARHELTTAKFATNLNFDNNNNNNNNINNNNNSISSTKIDSNENENEDLLSLKSKLMKNQTEIAELRSVT